MRPGPEYEPFDNELLTSYELGLKTQLLDGRMNLNLAVHHTAITDQQIRVRVFTPFPINRVFNIGDSYTQGFEGELTAMLTEGLLLSLSYSYTKSKFDKIDVPPAADPSDNINFLQGLPFPFVPENTGAASLQYTHPFRDDMSFTVFGGVRYVDSYITGLNTVANPLGGVTIFLPEVDSYTITTLKFSLDAERWSASLYVQNLFDENIILVQQLGSFYTNEPFNVLAAPRNIGARFEYRW